MPPRETRRVAPVALLAFAALLSGCLSGSETIFHEWEAGDLLVDGQPVATEPEWRLLHGRYDLQAPVHVVVSYAHGGREYDARLTLEGGIDTILDEEMPHQVEVAVQVQASRSGSRLEERAIAEVWAVHVDTHTGVHTPYPDARAHAAEWTERWRVSFDVRTARLDPVFFELQVRRGRRELTRSHPPQVYSYREGVR